MRSKSGTIDDRGAFIDIIAMAPGKYVEQLRKARRPVPTPQTIRALIDTGASSSVLDLIVITGLGLTETGRTLVHTPSSGSDYVERDQYAASLFIGSQPGETAEYIVSVVGTSLASEGFLAIIGWDILSKCVLHCDGPRKTFQLDY